MRFNLNAEMELAFTPERVAKVDCRHFADLLADLDGKLESASGLTVADVRVAMKAFFKQHAAIDLSDFEADSVWGSGHRMLREKNVRSAWTAASTPKSPNSTASTPSPGLTEQWDG